MLRRRIWFIVEAIVVVSVVAGIASHQRAPTYRTTARVFLEPGDPAEEVNPRPASVGDPNRFLQAQVDIVKSEAVAQLAATYVRGVTPRQLERRVAVNPSATSDILEISASDSTPKAARDEANAVARAYIENRRQSAVASLQKAAADLNGLLTPVQATVTDLDSKITAASKAGADADDPQLAALKGSREAAMAQYQSLYARQQELTANATLQRGAAELIAAAKLPSKPESPRPLRDAGAGAFAGLLAGTGIVLLREQLDDRMSSLGDVERTLGLPILARLPFDKESAKHPDVVAAIARPHGPLSEAVRSLRTSVWYASLGGPLRTVVVTSPLPSEGKSVVCANLAAVCAQAGLRTVLIGADLRRSSLSRRFGIMTGPGGVRAAFIGPPAPYARGTAGEAGPTPSTSPRSEHSVVKALILKPIRNLGFLPSGTIPPNPAELLSSTRMTAVLEEVAGAADFVVIDTPPLLPVTDAAVLGAQADGVILVVAMNETRRDAAKQAKMILEAAKAPILGVVVNKAPKAAVPYYFAHYLDGDAPGGRSEPSSEVQP